ncbi:MAG: histidine kinase, partial [Chloroflexi bacterium]|nr:histidine kinase [Chloroflexota bacterium]
LVKLTGGTLTFLLAILGATSWVITPAYISAYSPRLTGQQSLRFTPNASAGYDIAPIPFNFEADLGQKLAVTASGLARSQAVDFRFPFFGKTYSQVYVSSLGMLKMDSALYHPNLQYRYGQFPGIFPLLIDLQPAGAGGGVYARLAPDRLVVTWDRLPALHRPETIYTFQTVLYRDGRFDFNYQNFPDKLLFDTDTSPSSNLWLRGATPGGSMPVEMTSDLSSSAHSGPQGLLQDYNLDFRAYLDRFSRQLGWLVFAAAGLLLVFVPLSLNSNIVQPLNHLLASIQKLDSGNLDLSMPVQSLDEIGLLTQSFNRMVAWLKRMVGELEGRVVQRTAELELSNQKLMREASIRQASQAQALGHQRSLAALAERERVSRDLHDGLAQAIHAISLKAQVAQLMVSRGELETANSNLGDVVKMAQAANTDIRNVIAHLNIPQDRSLLAMHPVMEEQVLGIIQESLANIRKHSQASAAEVILSVDERSIQLSVSDDGVGFDPRQRLKDGGQHFGVDMMRERVDSLGGRLELNSAPGQGTRLIVFIPRLGVAELLPDSKGLLGYRVLLVDDSPILLDGLQKLLNASGLAVLGLARDGLQAQEMARTLSPDMLLMNIGLPKMAGLRL